MAALVWFTTGIAIWHFTVLVPDRFWGGIVGALLGAITGAMVTGALAQIALVREHRRDRLRDRALRDPRNPDRARDHLRGRRRRAAAR